MTRDDLLRENETTHRRVLDLIAGVPDDRLTAPGADGGWSVRDHLGHLASWQQYVADLLTGATEPRNIKNDAEMDSLNATIAAETRARPAAEVRALFQSSYDALRAQVERLGDAELDQPPPYGRDWDRKLWQHIAGNGFDHYREHLDAVETLLAT
jgi:uncharacterized damage-inducible protein DinB